MTKQFAPIRFFGRSLLFVLLLQTGISRADVRMPAIFGDHMVLQQEIKIPVWGWADADEAVTVTLGDKSAKATADADGKWKVDLAPVKTSTAPLTLTVAGKNNLKFSDVLVGDVWICSGQSNMEFDLGGDWKGKHTFGGAANAATAVPAANDPQLRLFVVKHKLAFDPEPDVEGTWQVCTPDSAALFSAVGYFFGQELRHTLNRPIGLIGSYWGGTPAEGWTSLSGLQKDPPFTAYVDAHQKVVTDYPKAKEEYPAAMAAYQDQVKQWTAANGAAYNAIIKQWHDAYNLAKANNQPLPPRPQPDPPMPKAPDSPTGTSQTPSLLFNGMIAPLIPYAIKGVIWYQGENNTKNGPEYTTLFPRMISDWREKWNEGDFPFLYVQLANFRTPQTSPVEANCGWAYVREAQLKTLSVPNTGMASAVDIGDKADIHPKDKLDVGLRMALAAKHVAYGQDLVYSGPIYDSMTVEGNKIRLTFKDTGSGLKMSPPSWTPIDTPMPTATELTGFAIAGADKNFVWAKAQIDGNTVVVSGDGVTSPVAVRYGWANDPPCNLYNKEGLPASPFRTDDWVEPPPPPAPATPPATAAAPAPVSKP